MAATKALNVSFAPIWASRRAARIGSRPSNRAASAAVIAGSRPRVMTAAPVLAAASWP